ncbi:MAG: hypothetical protein IPM86_07865 [Saprospiraceae bacterium]|nr:hypothetical protein [Saprospiraceae bacterium]
MSKQIDDKLYLRILQLGRENLTNGLKFNSLISTLQQEGYTINNCTNRSIREWFYNSFFHEEAHCQNGNFNNVQELDNHKNCGFVLKADTCMKLLQFEESEKSHKQIEVLTRQTEIYQKQVQLVQLQVSLTQQLSPESKQEATIAKNLAYGSIFISLLCGIPDLLSLTKDNDIDHLPTKIEETINQLPSTTTKTNQLLEHLVVDSQKDSMYLEAINESLKTLNNNLKRDKK